MLGPFSHAQVTSNVEFANSNLKMSYVRENSLQPHFVKVTSVWLISQGVIPSPTFRFSMKSLV